jgi:hypothetical protein
MRALPLFFATFKLFENAWFQQRQGTLDPEQWEGWDPYIRLYFHQPKVKGWWQTRRRIFAPGFGIISKRASRLTISRPSIDLSGATLDPGRRARGAPICYA